METARLAMMRRIAAEIGGRTATRCSKGEAGKHAGMGLPPRPIRFQRHCVLSLVFRYHNHALHYLLAKCLDLGAEVLDLEEWDMG
jgi:hypothetical protein